jgi:hypothetical protein
MDDILRVGDVERVAGYFFTMSLQVLQQLPAARGKLKSIHLVESSATMRALQEGKLRKASEEGNFEIIWHDAIEEIEHEEGIFTMLVAHEFFDVLPVNVIEVSSIQRTIIYFTSGIYRELNKAGTRCSSPLRVIQASNTPCLLRNQTRIQTLPRTCITRLRAGRVFFRQLRQHHRPSSDLRPLGSFRSLLGRV